MYERAHTKGFSNKFILLSLEVSLSMHVHYISTHVGGDISALCAECNRTWAWMCPMFYPWRQLVMGVLSQWSTGCVHAVLGASPVWPVFLNSLMSQCRGRDRLHNWFRPAQKMPVWAGSRDRGLDMRINERVLYSIFISFHFLLAFTLNNVAIICFNLISYYKQDWAGSIKKLWSNFDETWKGGWVGCLARDRACSILAWTLI